MSIKQTNVFKGLAIILMFIHHLFGDAGILETMQVSSILPKQVLLISASTGKVCFHKCVWNSKAGKGAK